MSFAFIVSDDPRARREPYGDEGGEPFGAGAIRETRSNLDRMVRVHGVALVLAACAACAASVGCGGGGVRRFPLRDAVWKDTDTRPVSLKCEERPSDKEPDHVSCAPEPYVSPLAWDAVDNTVFRPISKFFAVDPPQEAKNVNAFDEVPDSAWFENRLGKRKPSLDELLRGACRPEDMLDPDTSQPGAWLIDQGKPNGATPGFRVRVGKKKYMFKTDSQKEPERPSAASVIGAAIYHAVGFNTSCEQIVYFDRTLVKLKPGLKYTRNDGVTRLFDEGALDKVFAEAGKREDRYRFQASAWLKGFLLGPFKYEGMRSDDPNDVIPHEDRRDLRGGRLVAAWLHHFDAREQNSMDAWFAADEKNAESSPGYVRHYYLDTSDSLGSVWDWDGVSRRMGHSYLLDFADIGADFITLGIIERPWERKRQTPGMEMFGYFHWREFEPDDWLNEYPNPSFSRATEHDNAWMARILSRFDYADVKALVSLGKFTKPEAGEFLAQVLEMRLRKIVERYLLRLSPIADVRVDENNVLCGVDLARRRNARPESAFAYGAELRSPAGRSALRVERRPAGEICMPLAHFAKDGGSPDDDASRYARVRISNGASKGLLEAHVYDLGPVKGFRLVGLERPDP
jgi:hypothetical protein